VYGILQQKSENSGKHNCAHHRINTPYHHRSNTSSRFCPNNYPFICAYHSTYHSTYYSAYHSTYHCAHYSAYYRTYRT